MTRRRRRPRTTTPPSAASAGTLSWTVAALAARSLDEVTEVWDTALTEIAAKQDVSHAEEESDPTPFAELRRSYTMDSERKVHDEICGNAGPNEEVCVSGTTDDIDDDPFAALF